MIPTPVPPYTRLPEYYTTEHSRPPNPNFADYPIRVDGTTRDEPKNNPRFPNLTEQFITTNDTPSNKKEAELKRLQTANLKLKFEVKVKFQGLNPHPVFRVSKIEHKTIPAPFEVSYIELERDPQLLDLTCSRIVIYNPYTGLKYTISFQFCYPLLYNKYLTTFIHSHFHIHYTYFTNW